MYKCIFDIDHIVCNIYFVLYYMYLYELSNCLTCHNNDLKWLEESEGSDRWWAPGPIPHMYPQTLIIVYTE